MLRARDSSRFGPWLRAVGAASVFAALGLVPVAFHLWSELHVRGFTASNLRFFVALYGLAVGIVFVLSRLGSGAPIQLDLDAAPRPARVRRQPLRAALMRLAHRPSGVL